MDTWLLVGDRFDPMLIFERVDRLKKQRNATPFSIPILICLLLGELTKSNSPDPPQSWPCDTGYF